MNGALAVMLGVAAIIIASGLVKALQTHLKTRQERLSSVDQDSVAQRLDEMETRLRDVLDVMIAVSEKMDRWERDGLPTSYQREGV